MSSFYAKPYGGYTISSAEGTNNILRIYDYLHAEGYADGCIVGILGNVMAESSLNPWLWENNIYSLSNGYGLFQFTPASEYINASWIPDWAPNESTSIQTPGSDPDDALGQLYALVNDTFEKWLPYCWRTYWDPDEFTFLYDLHYYVLNNYGNGSTLTRGQFKDINDYEAACFAFLACYEGPAYPNYGQRISYCEEILPIIQAYVNKDDIPLMKRIRDIQFHRRFNVI